MRQLHRHVLWLPSCPRPRNRLRESECSFRTLGKHSGSSASILCEFDDLSATSHDQVLTIPLLDLLQPRRKSHLDDRRGRPASRRQHDHTLLYRRLCLSVPGGRRRCVRNHCQPLHSRLRGPELLDLAAGLSGILTSGTARRLSPRPS